MPTYDELYSQETALLRWPAEDVVRFTSKNLRDRSFKSVLDLGCGAGRHVIYLAKEGFRVIGCDIAWFGLEHARERLREEGLRAHLDVADITSLPYRVGCFDAVICRGAAFYNTYQGVRKVILEMHRVTRSGGLALVTLKSISDYRYRRGREVEPGTYETPDGPQQGLVLHFFTQQQALKVLEPFEILTMEHTTRTLNDMRYALADWVIIAQKART